MSRRFVQEVPASKSATQRALLLASLAEGKSVLHGALECDDSRYLRQNLRALGIEIEELENEWRVHGGRFTKPDKTLECGNAGTTVRFLSALAPLLPAPVRIEGNEHMRRRPMREVTEALAALGCSVEFHGEDGFVPFTITPPSSAAQEVHLDASRTSQFLSGLLMTGPWMGLKRITTGGEIISRPYLDLTLAMMEQFDQQPVTESEGAFTLPSGSYSPVEMSIEGDWSSAAMLLVGARLLDIEIDIPNLNRESLQGDRAILEHLAELDEPRSHRFNLSETPDLLPPLAIACLFAGQPSEIVNVEHARIKECDRIDAMARMIEAVGGEVEERRDGLLIQPANRLEPAQVDDRDDHRMAMAAGLLALRVPGVQTNHPECTSKSWPGFWDVLGRLVCT